MATRIGATGDDEMAGPDEAEIYLWHIGEDRLERLLQTKRSNEGIPVGLFWITDSELGWAGERTNGLVLYSTKLTNVTPRRLVETAFRVFQSRGYIGNYAPDDLAYDRDSGYLLFTGRVNAAEDASSNLVFTYHLPTKVLSVAPLAGAISGEVTVDGMISEGKGTRLFFAGLSSIYSNNSVSILWLSKSQFFEPSEIITQKEDGFIYFPRLSSNGKSLVWLQNSDVRGAYDLVLCNLHTREQSMLVKELKGWEGMNPALGCPYSWSPKGDQIAYADGSKVKFVKLPPDVQKYHEGTDS